MTTVIRLWAGMVVLLGVATAAPSNTVLGGAFGTTMAYAAEWAEGALWEIKGLERSSKNDEHPTRQSRVAADKVQLVMEGGKTLRLDPKVRIRAQGGGVISLEELPAQSRIRYSPVNGLVTEIMLLDLLAR